MSAADPLAGRSGTVGALEFLEAARLLSRWAALREEIEARRTEAEELVDAAGGHLDVVRALHLDGDQLVAHWRELTLPAAVTQAGLELARDFLAQRAS